MASILVAAALVVLASCTSDSRRRVVVYSPHGKEMLSLYEKGFERMHPDVDVQWIDMGGQDAFDRIRTEAVNPQASIWWGGARMAFSQAAEENLLQPYAPTWAGNVKPGEADPRDRWYGTFLTPEVIAYNSQLLAPQDAPADWDDLLEDRFEGKVIVRSPLASSTMRTIFGSMILRQPTVEEGFRWLASLDRQVKTYAADPTQLYLKLARGEGLVTLWNLPDIFLQADVNNYPFGFRIPETGSPVLTDGIALVRGGPNLDDARAFYEFVTSDSAVVEQAHLFYRIPVRNDIDTAALPDWMRALDLNPMELDWQRLATELPTWMQYWDENIKGRGADYLKRN